MSRTFRNPSKIEKGVKKVKDGTPTRYSHQCENNGTCAYCRSNRLHKSNKRLEAIEFERREYEF